MEIKIKQKESFDEKESVLPKWLLEKGRESTFGAPNTLDWLTVLLEMDVRKLKKYESAYNRIKSKIDKKSLRVLKETLGKEIYYLKKEIKRHKEELHQFRIDHFDASDVEVAFREVMGRVKKNGMDKRTL